MICCSSCGESGSHKFACDGVAEWSGEAWHAWCFVKENKGVDFTQVKLRPINRAWQRFKTTVKPSRSSIGTAVPYAKHVIAKMRSTPRLCMSTYAHNV